MWQTVNRVSILFLSGDEALDKEELRNYIKTLMTIPSLTTAEGMGQ